MNSGFLVSFAVMVAAVIVAVLILPPFGKLEIKAVPGQ
jgi:hypothetical protein